MTVECFRRRRFREASLSLLASLSEIASDYAVDGLRLTVRQFYYQCVARGWIENNEREYQKMSQDTRVIVVLEKAALSGVVRPVCEELDTPLLAAIGYSSCTLFYELAKEWICSALEAGQDVKQSRLQLVGAWGEA